MNHDFLEEEINNEDMLNGSNDMDKINEENLIKYLPIDDAGIIEQIRQNEKQIFNIKK